MADFYKVITPGQTTYVKKIVVGRPIRSVTASTQASFASLTDTRVTQVAEGHMISYDSSIGRYVNQPNITFDGSVLNVTGTFEVGDFQFENATIATSGDLTIDPAGGDIVVSSSKITNLAEPTSAADAATKNYVDEKTITIAGNVGSDTLNLLDSSIVATGINGIRTEIGSNTFEIVLDDTSVTPGTYGSASEVPVFTVDQQGRIDSAGTVSVAGVTDFVYDSATGQLTISTADGGTFASTVTFDPFTTTDLTEGTNLYYTRARRDSDLGNITVDLLPISDSSLDLGSATNKWKDLYLSGNSIYLGDLILSDDNGVFSVKDSAGTSLSINLSANSTSDLSEGSNLYYTTARADSDARHAVSASGDLSYNPATGVFSFDVEQVYTKVNFDSDFNVAIDEASLDGTGLTYNSGTNTLSITNTGVDAGTYGSASEVPVFTVNAQGQLDSAGTVSVAGVTNFTYDSSTGQLVISTADGGTFASTVTFDPFSTTNLAEGSNLYYTTARVDSAFDDRLAIKTTTNLAEGSNLYYTTARADSAFDARFDSSFDERLALTFTIPQPELIQMRRLLLA